MTKDFAKKKASSADKKTSKKPVKRRQNTRKASDKSNKPPLWAWIVVGLLVLGFVLFLIRVANQSANQDVGEPKEPPPVEQVEPEKNDEVSQVRFDFYEILREQEIDVSERVIEKTPEQKDIDYFLQVGSFKTPEEADTFRARLILMGLPASVEETVNKNQQLWHRVLAGPFDTRSKLAKARSTLASERIDSFVIKRPRS